MLIQSEFDIRFRLPYETAMIVMLHLHPSLEPLLRTGNELLAETRASGPFGFNSSNDGGSGEDDAFVVPSTDYVDSFGNRCARLLAPSGYLRLSGSNILNAPDEQDQSYVSAQQAPIQLLPSDVLQFLLPSRYCQVDQFGAIAQDLFGHVPAGWERAVAIRDWVHDKVAFNYNAARPTKTSMDVFTERVGVCRDFQHLAITLSRCLNIPARYATGYIGDIRRPYSGPGDFSAWYQVFLDGQWIDFDARHNYPRYGRLLMAVGRDAADVALTTSFGAAYLDYFYVESNEIDANGEKFPLPLFGPDGTFAPPAHAANNTPTQTNASQSSPTQTQAATL